MTLFCPNCGKPNTDEATQCVACGTELQPKSSQKFKGTMMMSGVAVPQPPGQQEGGPQAPGGAPGGAPPAGGAPGGGQPAAPPPPGGGGFGAP
ncbi:MAG TPA: zinc-ribbon domain-containing protein, partial [Sandaracinaceae bacterium LLY-WYZ-13_1]|nr:zinc-ribbon domain-containing protein [Sandaracinaceae bacterium LLY-WYZ-13_1]